jgi:hypothetical protein
MNDLDAEIELRMGEEGEKHIIMSPTIVYMPAKMIHEVAKAYFAITDPWRC